MANLGDNVKNVCCKIEVDKHVLNHTFIRFANLSILNTTELNWEYHYNILRYPQEYIRDKSMQCVPLRT